MLWILCLATIALISDSSFADPRQWDLQGLTVREANYMRWWGKTASADDGASMLVWTLEKRGKPELYGQWLSPDGSEVSDFNGRLLARGGHAGINYPDVQFVGDGYVATWLDLDVSVEEEGYLYQGRIKAMKYSADGTRMWDAPALDGVLILDGGATEYLPYLVTCNDNNGGAYIHWVTQGHWYLQRVTSAGTLAWASPLELPLAYNWTSYAITSDGEGGVFAAWRAQSSVFCQRFDATGAALWPQPVLLGNGAASNPNIYIFGDGTGGVLASWDTNGSVGQVTRAQRLNSNGQLVWLEGGVQVTDQHYGYTRAALSFAQGAIDGLLLGWRNESDPFYDRVFVQKVSLTSELLWSTSELCESSEQMLIQEMGRIVSDNLGGALIVWEEQSTEDYSFKLSHVNASGASVWNDCSVEYSSESYASGARVLLGGGNRAIVVWDGDPSNGGHLWVKAFDLDNGALTSTLQLDDYLFGDVGEFAMLALPSGRTVLVWEDTREFSFQTLYYKILDADGSSEFPENGRELVTPADDGIEIYENSLCEDGAGGFFCVFGSYENGYRYLRVTRRSADGTRIGPESGQLLETPVHEQRDARCIPDGAEGAFVAWSEFDESFQLDLYAQRVNFQCQPMWNSPTTIMNNPLVDDYVVGLVPGTNGSCIVFGETGEFPAYYTEAIRVAAGGSIDWQVVATPDSIRTSDIIPDGQGGAAYAWRGGYGSASHRPSVQRLDANGNLLWPMNGVRIDTVSIITSYPRIGIDEAGHLFATYYSIDESDRSIVRVQKFSPTGDLLWSETARMFETNSSSLGFPEIAVVNSENIYVCWSELNADFCRNILTLHLNSNGESASDVFWNDNTGSELIESPLGTLNYQLIVGEDYGVTCGWSEYSSSGYPISLAAQRIFDPIPVSVAETPVLPTEFSLAQNYPNPFNPETVMEFSIPVAGKTSLKVFDVTGRLVATLVDEQVSAGVHRAHFDGSKLSSGVYFYKLEAAERSFTRKMVLVK